MNTVITETIYAATERTPLGTYIVYNKILGLEIPLTFISEDAARTFTAALSRSYAKLDGEFGYTRHSA